MKQLLIIEPDSVLATQYMDFFAGDYDVRTVSTAQAAILAADKKSPDIIIVEPLLAAHSGIEFLYEFRSYAEWQHAPIIIASRARGETLGIHGAALKQCGIAAVCYNPETSLHKLAHEVKKALA